MTKTLEELLTVQPTVQEPKKEVEITQYDGVSENVNPESESEPITIENENSSLQDDDINNQNIEVSDEQDDGDDEKIPEYLYKDSQIVGFSDSQVQNDVYNLSMLGTLPLTGDISILDVGAKRGDFYRHVKSNSPELLNISYTGWEMNPLLVKVGNDITKDDPSYNLNYGDFMTQNITDKYDYVFVIGELNIDYGRDIPPHDLVELMIRKCLDVENGGTSTIILLQDNGGEDQYYSYPIPNISELILKFNYPFTIEYGVIPSVYKLTIVKQPIFLI